LTISDFSLKLCEFLEKLGKTSCDGVTYILLFILNPGHEYAEVKKKQMILRKTLKTTEDLESTQIDENCTTMNVEAARAYFEEEVKRSQVINDKNKVLLTIAALLVAANAALASSIEPKWMVLVPLILTVISIFLVLVHFGVRSVPIPKYEITDENELAKSYSDCTKQFSRANEFRVGVYLASCRAVTLGVLLLVVIFIFFAFAGSSSCEDKQIKSMKNNMELQNLLRGPQGPAGPKRERGAEGPQGIQCLPGPTGKVVIVPQTLPENRTKEAEPNNRYCQ